MINKWMWNYVPWWIHDVIAFLTHREMVLGEDRLWWDWVEKSKERK